MKKTLLLTGLLMAMGLMMVVPGTAVGEVLSSEKPLIPYVDFGTEDITFDAMTSEGNFNEYKVKTSNDVTITINWRHNDQNLHAVVSATTNGWVALGWHAEKPSETSGINVMKDANIIIGSYDSENNESLYRDDIGIAGDHLADTSDGGTDDIINASTRDSGDSVWFEFLVPLDSGDTADKPLVSNSHAYFIVASGAADDLALGHNNAVGALYINDPVWVQTTEGEAYQETGGSAPGFEAVALVMGLGLLGLVAIKRKA